MGHACSSNILLFQINSFRRFYKSSDSEYGEDHMNADEDDDEDDEGVDEIDEHED